MKRQWIICLALFLALVTAGCKSEDNEAEGNAVAPSWTPIVGNQFNMIVLGIVNRNGSPAAANRYWVGSYGPGGIDADCRSVSPVTAGGNYYATVRGSKNGETILFKIWDGIAKKILDASESVSFLADDTKTNYNLNFSEAGQ